jgi:endonuclease YncB( thermonuclease family)
MYEYACRMIRIINGNTVEADIDLGFEISIRMNIKLYGVSASEQAKDELIRLLTKRFVCRTLYNKRGKIGRVLGYVYVEDETGDLININDVMIAQGHSLAE